MLKSGFTKNLKWEVQQRTGILGKKCIDNTIKLIQYFKPKYWYIENPRTSMIWKYITLNHKEFYDENNMFLNKTIYGSYGFPINKQTIFLSNVKMNLLFSMKKTEYEYYEENGIKWKQVKGTNTRTRMDHGGLAGLTAISKKGENSEATERSHIPETLIRDIFSYFKIDENIIV